MHIYIRMCANTCRDNFLKQLLSRTYVYMYVWVPKYMNIIYGTFVAMYV